MDNWNADNYKSALSKKPIVFKTFYKTKPDFYSLNTKDFRLRVNPVIYFQGGKDNTYNGNLYTNTRGITVRV